MLQWLSIWNSQKIFGCGKELAKMLPWGKHLNDRSYLSIFFLNILKLLHTLLKLKGIDIYVFLELFFPLNRLTLSQTTNFGLFETKSVGRRQFRI